MKDLLILLFIAFVFLIMTTMCDIFPPNNAHGQESEETYAQCRTRVLNEIAEQEAHTGKKVSSENKLLSVQAYCSGKLNIRGNTQKQYGEMRKGY